MVRALVKNGIDQLEMFPNVEKKQIKTNIEEVGNWMVRRPMDNNLIYIVATIVPSVCDPCPRDFIASSVVLPTLAF